LGGWRVNGVLFVQSGAPFTVNVGVDRANVGAGPAQRPDQLRDPNLPASERAPGRWFDTAAFAMPAPFTFGSAPRNSVIGPGYASVDLGVAKTYRMAGTRRLELRCEVFNVLNTANFDLPSSFVKLVWRERFTDPRRMRSRTTRFGVSSRNKSVEFCPITSSTPLIQDVSAHPADGPVSGLGEGRLSRRSRRRSPKSDGPTTCPL
jgi:hypothetical protein